MQAQAQAQIVMPLVGAKFNRPALQLLAVLPQGTEVELVPDPDNPYDSKAIKVEIRLDDLLTAVDSSMEGILAGTGMDEGDLLTLARENGGNITLGHLPNSEGQICKKLGCQGNAEISSALAEAGKTWDETLATLRFDSNSSPQILIFLD